jgi:hypothetical protein
MGSRRANSASQQQELYCTLGWPCPGEQFPKQHPPSGPFESRRLPLCGTPTATGSRARAGPVIDTRIAASPSWNLRWPRTHCIMHNVAVGIQRRLRTTMPPCAFGAAIDSICAALTAHNRDSLTGKPPSRRSNPARFRPECGVPRNKYDLGDVTGTGTRRLATRCACMRQVPSRL